MMKILLIDDHALFRAGMRHVLTGIAPHVEVLGAGDVDSALSIAREHPDLSLVLMDLCMPGLSGVEGVSSFRQCFPTVPLVVLSATEDSREIARVMRAGAAGYIPKTSTQDVMLAALEIVLRGGTYVPPQAIGLIPGAGYPAVPMSSTSAAVREPTGSERDPVGLQARLTPRQLEVLGLLVQGHPNKKIARMLGIEPSTIKMHLTIIFGALRVSNRTQAVAAAYRLGLDLPEHQSGEALHAP